MSLLDVRSRLDERSATVYLAVGTLAALKAVALRNDRKRFRRELREAALFLGLGLALRTYHRRRQSGTDEEAEPATEADVAEDGAEVTTDSTDDGETRDDQRTRLERTARRLVPTN